MTIIQYNKSLVFSLTNQMTEQFKRVGDYRFIRRIGKGATSEVFQAKKEGSNDRYAVKMIRLKGLNSEQKQIVTKEVSIIKNINHPNIIHLYETFQTSNNYYLVFQYCQRGDLEKYLTEYYSSRLPQETAQRIIFCIADAVSLIHSKGITHRDIKLANILLKKDYQIKLADFGFAKEQSKKLFMETYCGTPITMAPQIMKNKPYDKKVDIWSLGVITFQLIYGKLPFPTSEGLPKFMEYVTEHPLEIPSQPPMSIEFKQLIMCSLQKNPEKRYDIKEFLNNKWVQEGSQNTLAQGSIKKKPSVEELLQKVSQEIKHEHQEMHMNSSSEIEILVAQRVNKLIVSELKKIIRKHEQSRQDLLKRVGDDESMKNLLFKLDYTFLDFLRNLQIKVGKESSTQIIKASELYGLEFPKSLVFINPVCDTAGNVIYKYLQKAAHEVYQLEQKKKMYQLAYDFLDLVQRFDIRIIVLFANHLYEDFEVGNMIANIRQKKINEEISEQIEFTRGNYITLAMQCSDKDPKMKNVRQTLRKNIRKRIDEIKKELGGF